MPTFELPRLPQTAPSHAELQVWWQQVVEAIEAEFGSLSVATAAATAAANAATAAATAQTAATDAARELARLNSYPDPTNVLTAADVGADATITIAAHNRIYPVQGSIDVPDLAVAGGTITGRAFSTQYSVYYDDTTLADTTPTYQAVLTASAHATSQPGAAAGRHFVGVITTPADGAGGTGGTGGGPPGGGGGIPLP
jgi:hypothetical protein